jgi:succinyl-diaminopimelate desuccinylase
LSNLSDPLPLAQSLIRCASVTPADAGAQDALSGMLSRLGFTINRLRYGGIENIFARLGTGGPHIRSAERYGTVCCTGAARVT